MSILDTLITNRVPGAAYGWTDMNRVAEAMEYVASRLNSCGYNVNVAPRRFTREDLPTEAVFEEYMAQLQQLRDAITLIVTTPPVPGVSRSRPYMTVQEANDIEKILLDIDAVLAAMQKSRLYTAQPLLYCGFAVYMTVGPKAAVSPVFDLDPAAGELSVTYPEGYDGPTFEVAENGDLSATYPDDYTGPEYTVDSDGYLVAST